MRFNENLTNVVVAVVNLEAHATQELSHQGSNAIESGTYTRVFNNAFRRIASKNFFYCHRPFVFGSQVGVGIGIILDPLVSPVTYSRISSVEIKQRLL